MAVVLNFGKAKFPWNPWAAPGKPAPYATIGAVVGHGFTLAAAKLAGVHARAKFEDTDEKWVSDNAFTDTVLCWHDPDVLFDALRLVRTLDHIDPVMAPSRTDWWMEFQHIWMDEPWKTKKTEWAMFGSSSAVMAAAQAVSHSLTSFAQAADKAQAVLSQADWSDIELKTLTAGQKPQFMGMDVAGAAGLDETFVGLVDQSGSGKMLWAKSPLHVDHGEYGMPLQPIVYGGMKSGKTMMMQQMPKTVPKYVKPDAPKMDGYPQVKVGGFAPLQLTAEEVYAAGNAAPFAIWEMHPAIAHKSPKHLACAVQIHATDFNEPKLAALLMALEISPGMYVSDMCLYKDVEHIVAPVSQPYGTEAYPMTSAEDTVVDKIQGKYQKSDGPLTEFVFQLTKPAAKKSVKGMLMTIGKDLMVTLKFPPASSVHTIKQMLTAVAIQQDWPDTGKVEIQHMKIEPLKQLHGQPYKVMQVTGYANLPSTTGWEWFDVKV